jgi:hypothetical protein
VLTVADVQPYDEVELSGTGLVAYHDGDEEAGIHRVEVRGREYVHLGPTAGCWSVRAGADTDVLPLPEIPETWVACMDAGSNQWVRDPDRPEVWHQQGTGVTAGPIGLLASGPLTRTEMP